MNQQSQQKSTHPPDTNIPQESQTKLDKIFRKLKLLQKKLT